MRQLFFIAIGITTLTGCNKSTPDNTTRVTTSAADTFTLTDNGTTYTQIEDSTHSMICRLFVGSTANTFILANTAQSTIMPAFPLYIAVRAPITGTGVYRLIPIDSTNFSGFSLNEYAFIEEFNGGSAYDTDSLVLTITKDSATTITGNYQLWLSNATDTKTVTGTINCHHLSIIP